MDDDLLGGPGPAYNAAASTGLDDDDLLGGPAPAAAADTAAAFDDDLLFGGPAPAPAPVNAGGAADQPVGTPGHMEPGDFAERGPKVPLKLQPVKEVPQALVNLVDADTFYLRPLILVGADGTRGKTLLRVTSTQIQLHYEQTLEVSRSVEVAQIIGILTAGVIVKSLMSKNYEVQAVIQIADGADVHVGFTREAGPDALSNLSNVLTAVCASHGLVLPICSLTNSEHLSDHIQRIAVDPRLRRQLCEALAYRTEMQNEASTLQKEDSKLEMSIASIKSSNSGHDAMNVVQEIQKLEILIDSYSHKAAEVRAMIATARGQLGDVQASLKREQQRRESAVNNAVEDKQKQRLLKQVADYEVAKASHKRELDRIAAVTALYERRARDRTKDAYGIHDLPLRLDDLDEQLEDITGRLSAKGDDHSKRVAALAENKRRMARAEAAMAQLQDDIKAIEGAADGDTLPETLRTREVPDLSPVVPTGRVAAAPSSGGSAAPVSGAAAPAKAPVSLDDDDDDFGDMPPPKASAAAPTAAAKPAPVSLSDDDI